MLADEAKTKEQLIRELTEMCQRLAELGKAEAERLRMVKQLRESEERYRDLYDEAPIAYFSVDTTGRIMTANHSAEELLGYKLYELIGKPVFDLYADTAAGKPKAQEILQRFVTGEHIQSEELEMVKKDGSRAWISLSVRPIKDVKGKVLASRSIVLDITERKQAEESLRESEKKSREAKESYDRIIDNADEVIFRVKAEGGHVIYANPAAERLLGYTQAEWLADNTLSFKIIHPDFAEKQQQIIREINTTKKPIKNAILGWVAKDGREVIVEYTVIPVTDEKGEIIYFESIGRDITERKRAEETLRESEEKYRSLVNNIKLGVFRSTPEPNGRFLAVNPAMEEITGYSREELLQMNVADLYAQPEERELILAEIVSGVGNITKELPLRRKDGTEIVVSDTRVVVRDDAGKILYFDGIMEDITERKQTEEREKRLQEELYLSSRLASIGELAAGVAHEINNPLTGIIGFSELLLRKSTDETVRRDLERIHNEGQRVAKVVQNLLTFARRREPKKEYADTNDIVQSALELRAYELKTGNIKVVTNLAPNLPRIIADFQQIEEVFLNIILNAEQVMTEAKRGGKLSIKTQQMKDYIRISFTDDGPGIPAEHLDKLFDPFFTTRGEKGGTGLGLSICHGIVTEHGGRMYTKSKPGEGATFFVELPLATEETDKSKIVEK